VGIDGGGGIRNDGGTVTLTDSTLTGNTVTSEGGGIYSVGALVLNNAALVVLFPQPDRAAQRAR